MRFDKQVSLITLENISDGLGGRTEVENIIADKLANVEEMSLEYNMNLFGEAREQNIKVIILGRVNKINKIRVSEKQYKVISQRTIKNKTVFLAEVIDED